LLISKGRYRPHRPPCTQAASRFNGDLGVTPNAGLTLVEHSITGDDWNVWRPLRDGGSGPLGKFFHLLAEY
jgi:hypothetical protein